MWNIKFIICGSIRKQIIKIIKSRKCDCTQAHTSRLMFLSSHEPCSLCLSAITFSGFDNFYYLFPYAATNDDFNIPHDLNILKEVFKINDGEYNKENSYWKSQNINLLIENLPPSKKEKILNQLNEIRKKYQTLSNQYQENKDGNSIPLN